MNWRQAYYLDFRFLVVVGGFSPFSLNIKFMTQTIIWCRWRYLWISHNWPFYCVLTWYLDSFSGSLPKLQYKETKSFSSCNFMTYFKYELKVNTRCDRKNISKDFKYRWGKWQAKICIVWHLKKQGTDSWLNLAIFIEIFNWI